MSTVGRVLEERVVRLHDAPTGQGVAHDDRDDLRLDERGDRLNSAALACS